MKKYKHNLCFGFPPWGAISSHQVLSENFIKKYSNKLHWNKIVQWQKISNDLIEENLNKIKIYNYIWEIICQKQSLSEDFIEKHQDKVIWSLISQYQNLSENFIEKFKNKIVWNKLNYKNLSVKFLKKFVDYIDWKSLFFEKHLSEDFIEEYIGYFTCDRVVWNYISRYQKLSENFMRKFSANLNWVELCSCQDFSDEFILEFHHKTNDLALMKYQKLSNNIANFLINENHAWNYLIPKCYFDFQNHLTFI